MHDQEQVRKSKAHRAGGSSPARRTGETVQISRSRPSLASQSRMVRTGWRNLARLISDRGQ